LRGMSGWLGYQPFSDMTGRLADLRGRSWRDLATRVGPIGVLLALVLGYAVFYGLWSVRKYHAYQAPAFDMAIFDQGVWLLSRFRDPFVTILGLNLFGDHAVFLMVLFVPLYWIAPGPETLLVTQSALLAIGAVPLYLLSRGVLRSRWLALLPALAYLLYPALGWLNLENFHPDSLGVPLGLFALYFMTRSRWRCYLVMVGMLLLVKEDVWLLVLPLGIYVAARKNLRVGLITVGVSVVWFLLAFFWIQPALSGVAAGSLDSWRIPFGGYGGLVESLFSRPWEVIAYMFTAEKVQYLVQLLTPLLFLPLLTWRALIAVPVLFFNLISTFWYQTNLQYHYHSLLIPVLWVAGIMALQRFRWMQIRWALVIAVLLATTLSAYLWGPLPGSRTPSTYPGTGGSGIVAADEALSLIPEDAVVAAEDRFAAHLANRELVYIFPNPYSASYWGDDSMKGQRLPRAEAVEYVVVAPRGLGPEGAEVYGSLASEGFKKIFEKNGIVVLRKDTQHAL